MYYYNLFCSNCVLPEVLTKIEFQNSPEDENYLMLHKISIQVLAQINFQNPGHKCNRVQQIIFFNSPETDAFYKCISHKKQLLGTTTATAVKTLYTRYIYQIGVY